MQIAKLHKVNIGVNEESPIIHSQMVFSAILNALPNKAEELLKNNDFTISSLFPFLGKNIFLPIINPLFLTSVNKLDYETKKKLKKEKLVKVDAFKKGLSEEDLEEWNETFFNSENFFEKQAHNSVSRKALDSDETKLFFSFRMRTNEKNGLWFSYPEEFEKEIKKALAKIQNFGFGRDKSTSSKPFEKFDFIEVKEAGDSFVNLGLYSPTKEEISNFIEKSRIESNAPKYELKKYAGWTESIKDNRIITKEKPGKYYFKEGSVFPFIGKSVYGERKKYNELEGNFKHPIYWNGITPSFRFNRVI